VTCISKEKKAGVTMSYKLQKRILLFTFLFAPIVLLSLFLVWPTIRMVIYSFTDWDGVLPSYNFIGIKNFVNVIKDEALWGSLKNNIAYIIAGLLQNILALFFAVTLNRKMRAKEFYKTITFMPYIINITAIAYMFNFLYDYNEGPINLLLKHFHLIPVKFFSDAHIAIFSLASMSFWRWLGYSMIIYIAALQSVPQEIYESSAIDGANSWNTFRYITFPSIINIVQLQLFLSLSGALQAFTETLVLTKGGPGKATYTFVYYILDNYINFNAYGYAAAMSVLLIMIILLITGFQRLVLGGGKKV